jgi:hypothetical protein
MMDMMIKPPSIWVSIPVSIPVSMSIDAGIDSERSCFLGVRSPRKEAPDG